MKIKSIVGLATMVTILFSLMTVNADNSIKMQNKWLSVSKNTSGPRYIVNSQGDPFRLFGMARSQYEAPRAEDPYYIGVEGLSKHFKERGCNTIRLALSPSNKFQWKSTDEMDDQIIRSGGYNPEGIQKWITQFVDPDVQGIIKSGMYIMLDLHEYPPLDISNQAKVQWAYDHYLPVWIELAKRYKDEPMIAIYEIWNEPYPHNLYQLEDDGYDWRGGLRQFYIDAVNEIRKIDEKHILMVSDDNAGWGTAWTNMWKNHLSKVDPQYKNTVFSIHVAKQQLDTEFAYYNDWWASIGTQHNSAIVFGEIETEADLMNQKGISNLIQMFQSKKNTHHYAGYLWRPHNDEANYVSSWKDFAKAYSSKIEHSQWFIEAENTQANVLEKLEKADAFGAPFSLNGVHVKADAPLGARGEVLTGLTFPKGTYEFRVRAKGDSKNKGSFSVGYVTPSGNIKELFTVNGKTSSDYYEISYAFTAADSFRNLVITKKSAEGTPSNFIDRITIRADKEITAQKADREPILQDKTNSASSKITTVSESKESGELDKSSVPSVTAESNEVSETEGADSELIPSDKPNPKPKGGNLFLGIAALAGVFLAASAAGFYVFKKRHKKVPEQDDTEN